MASLHLNEWGASMFPAWLRDDGLGTDETGSRRRPNLSSAARRYLDTLDMGVEDLFHHVLAVLHDPRLPPGQRRRAAHGMAPHSPPRLARPILPIHRRVRYSYERIPSPSTGEG